MLTKILENKSNIESTNLIVFPSLMGSSAFFNSLVPYFKQLNEKCLRAECDYTNFIFNMFGIVDDRLIKNKQTNSFSLQSDLAEEFISIEELAKKFANQIIQNNSICGNCFLLGWSFGGYLAYQVGLEIENIKNIDVELSSKAKAINPCIIVIDTISPNIKHTSPFNIKIERIFEAIDDIIKNLKISSQIQDKLKIDEKIFLVKNDNINDFVEELIIYYRELQKTEPDLKEIIYIFENVFFQNIKALYKYNTGIESNLPMFVISAETTIQEYNNSIDLGWGSESCISEKISEADHYNLFTDNSQNLFNLIEMFVKKIMLKQTSNRISNTFKKLKTLSLSNDEVKETLNTLQKDLMNIFRESF